MAPLQGAVRNRAKWLPCKEQFGTEIIGSIGIMIYRNIFWGHAGLFLIVLFIGCKGGESAASKAPTDRRETASDSPAKTTGPVAELRFSDESNAEFADCKPNQAIKISAECSGVKDGKLGLFMGTRYWGLRPSIPIPALFKAYSDDPAAAKKKYGTREMVVEGKVLALGNHVLTLPPANHQNLAKPTR